MEQDSEDVNAEFAPLILTTKKREDPRNSLRASGLNRIQQDMLHVNQLFKDLSGIAVQQVRSQFSTS